MENEYIEERCWICNFKLRIKGKEEWTRSELKKTGRHTGIGEYLVCDKCKRNYIRYNNKGERL